MKELLKKFYDDAVKNNGWYLCDAVALEEEAGIDPKEISEVLLKLEAMNIQRLEADDDKEQLSFSVLSEDGKVTEYELILAYHNEANGKDYMVYTDNSLDENGDINTFASIYIPNTNPVELIPIETDEEWDLIGELLESYCEDQYDGEDYDKYDDEK